MVNVFFSYCHKDESMRNELEIHLTTLKRQGIISAWHDRRIILGQEWEREISEHLEQAQIILLLISPYFIASDYCYDIEMQRALERHERGEAKVIPVILEHCNWHKLPFGKLQATPKDGKPISKFANQHEALMEITQSLQLAIESLNLPMQAPDFPLAINQPHTNRQTSQTNIRSSNLRLKKTFSDYEKDQFLKEAFQYVANFFENSLQELETRNSHIKVSFQLIDAVSFEATVYVEGTKRSRCGIRLDQNRSGGSIIYNHGGITQNSFGQMLSVEDDGYTLYLSATMAHFYSSNQTEQLSPLGGAELFWGYLVEPLQT